ncbi:MAG TPA: hypothetical protein VFU15_16445 [Bacteroidia bacterium]|nr:hypothetical protein [Bacteroidia bacterium]
MKYITLLVFFGFSFPARGKDVPTLRDLFLSLPDSVFIKDNRCFHQKDSFPVVERKQLLAGFDSGNVENKGDGPRFPMFGLSDSSGILEFGTGDETTVLSILSRDKKETFFLVASSDCDFIACFQSFHFYSLKKKKISEVNNVLPALYPAKLFFDTAYLAQQKFDPDQGLDGIEIVFTGDPHLLVASLNTDFFDPELFGYENAMTQLDASKIKWYSYRLDFDPVKRKFVVGVCADE